MLAKACNIVFNRIFRAMDSHRLDAEAQRRGETQRKAKKGEGI
jgi:hypothetical protein